MNETVRVSRILETHFCENLRFRFMYLGQEIAPMSVFHSGFMLGMAAYMVDASRLNEEDEPIIESVEASEDGFFKCKFNFNAVNGFKLALILSALEMLFGISATEEYPDEDREFELSETIDGLLKNYIEPQLNAT